MKEYFHSLRTGPVPSGVSLVELIVVLAIISIMLAFFFPAVQRARVSAQETVCKSNVHQIFIAAETINGLGFRPPMEGKPGGWSIALLPLLDPTNVFLKYPELDVAATDKEFLRRPRALTCPMGSRTLNSDGFDKTHYIVNMRYITDDVIQGEKTKAQLFVSDASIDTQDAWFTGLNYVRNYDKGPHRGLFFKTHQNGVIYSGEK